MNEQELIDALNLQIQNNIKLTQVIMEMSQKLAKCSAVIENLIEKLEERSAK